MRRTPAEPHFNIPARPPLLSSGPQTMVPRVGVLYEPVQKAELGVSGVGADLHKAHQLLGVEDFVSARQVLCLLALPLAAVLLSVSAFRRVSAVYRCLLPRFRGARYLSLRFTIFLCLSFADKAAATLPLSCFTVFSCRPPFNSFVSISAFRRFLGLRGVEISKGLFLPFACPSLADKSCRDRSIRPSSGTTGWAVTLTSARSVAPTSCP